MEAPVTYIQNQVNDAEEAFELIWNGLPWEQRKDAPRRECWFNPYEQAYTYGSGEYARTYEAHSFEENHASRLIKDIMDDINNQHGSSYDCCFVNGYEHGRQHLGWHADDSPEMDQDHPIATVSLGAEREIWFRQRIEWKESLNRLAAPKWGVTEVLKLGHGSAAIMHGGMQRSWQHRIPKSSDTHCGARISLTYRKLVR